MKKFLVAVFSFFIFSFSQNIFADESTVLLRQILVVDEAMKAYDAAMSGDITKQLNAMTGVTDLGSLLNGTAEQDERKWSPSEWAKVVSGGNESRYKELLEQYQAAHPTLSASEASAGMSSTNATDYQQQVETNQAASSQATYAFNQSNTHLDNIKKISDEINKSKDTKHIQDLNTRMNAEIAYLQVEIIKGIAVMNEQMAQQQATEIHDRTEAAKFNQIPE